MKAKPPKGFVHWDEGTFNRLVAAQPEPLASKFKVTHSMLLEVLDRPGDGCAAMKRLLTDNDEDRPARRRHIRQAIAIYRSMLAAGVLERLEVPDEMGRRVRLTVDLQDDFALNQPLSLFVLDAVPRLDGASPEWDLDVVSVVESTLEGPRPVLMAQLERATAVPRLATFETGGGRVRGPYGGAERARAPQTTGGFSLCRLRRVPRPPSLGARPRRPSQVNCPRHVRALDGFRGIRGLLRSFPVRRASCSGIYRTPTKHWCKTSPKS